MSDLVQSRWQTEHVWSWSEHTSLIWLVCSWSDWYVDDDGNMNNEDNVEDYDNDNDQDVDDDNTNDDNDVDANMEN